VFELINQDMTKYISNVLNVSKENADKIRMDYWQRYGSTLRGLQINHRIQTNDFLKKTHDLKKIESKIKPVRYIKKIMHSIREDKIVLTNAPKHYADFVLKKIGIFHHFKKIICIEDNFYIPKPNQNVFKSVKKLPYEKFILIDDNKENLKQAFFCGFITLHLSCIREQNAYINFRLNQLNKILKLKNI